MKKWNTPELAVLNLNETESGLIDFCFEFWPVFDGPECPGKPGKPEESNKGESNTPNEENIADSIS